MSTIENIPDRKKIPIEKALFFLTDHIKTIKNVADWAQGMGYSRSYFSRSIHLIYSESAIELFHKAKLASICAAWQKKPHAKAYEIAKDTGYKNGKFMGQFLWHNFGVNTYHIRERCAEGFNTGYLLRLSKTEIRNIFLLIVVNKSK